jgi:uncharacterized membrane-anchored protein
MIKASKIGIAKISATKIPEVTLAFWIIKIAATTLGETGGDALSMTLNLGYAISTGIFSIFFFAAVAAQIKAKSYHPFLYWAVIVATTTVGTTMADFVDRSLGIGYIGGSLILLSLLIGVIAAWRVSSGSVSIKKIKSTKDEAFYWVTILLSNTLGTALGDFFADDSGFGYVVSVLIFLSVLLVIAFLYFTTRLSRTVLFWLAFILTRPLGATVGDFLTKTPDKGGLELSRIDSSLLIAVFMIICIYLTTKKAKNLSNSLS